MAKLTHRPKHRPKIPISPSDISDEDFPQQPDYEQDPELDEYDSYTPTSEPQQSNTTTNLIPQSYINVAPLPVFRGGPTECPVAHLTRFARVCRANNATTAAMQARIFPVTLDDYASLWYELVIEPDGNLAWDDTKHAFIAAFRRADEARAELMGIKQKEKESVGWYYLRLKWVLRKWPENGLSDEAVKGVFVDGLKEEVMEWVVLQRPGSLEEAVEVAVAWEEAERVREGRRRGRGRCGFCGDGGHEEGRCGLRRRVREVVREEGKKVGEEEEEEERGECLCLKHQCWKRFERSVSAPVVRMGKNIGGGK